MPSVNHKSITHQMPIPDGKSQHSLMIAITTEEVRATCGGSITHHLAAMEAQVKV